ncbi:hypothetical protein AAFF_G00271300 [Aldrovandia affinis]|uniref:Uncharacterized protein n=1 Tax=Aldrovandia affinis TaxID=143900 RepID=A0AAD7RB42_9TELE|nr:hypothetical protein AAFF_G00271300 [Aldrovandia affinis]
MEAASRATKSRPLNQFPLIGAERGADQGVPGAVRARERGAIVPACKVRAEEGQIHPDAQRRWEGARVLRVFPVPLMPSGPRLLHDTHDARAPLVAQSGFAAIPQHNQEAYPPRPCAPGSLSVAPHAQPCLTRKVDPGLLSLIKAHCVRAHGVKGGWKIGGWLTCLAGPFLERPAEKCTVSPKKPGQGAAGLFAQRPLWIVDKVTRVVVLAGRVRGSRCPQAPNSFPGYGDAKSCSKILPPGQHSRHGSEGRGLLRPGRPSLCRSLCRTVCQKQSTAALGRRTARPTLDAGLFLLTEGRLLATPPLCGGGVRCVLKVDPGQRYALWAPSPRATARLRPRGRREWGGRDGAGDIGRPVTRPVKDKEKERVLLLCSSPVKRPSRGQEAVATAPEAADSERERPRGVRAGRAAQAGPRPSRGTGPACSSGRICILSQTEPDACALSLFTGENERRLCEVTSDWTEALDAGAGPTERGASTALLEIGFATSRSERSETSSTEPHLAEPIETAPLHTALKTHAPPRQRPSHAFRAQCLEHMLQTADTRAGDA